jgi:hypothetical protein
MRANPSVWFRSAVSLSLRLAPPTISEIASPHGQWSAATRPFRLRLTMIFAGK